ncbi:MAG: methyltransferase [Terracidiphilus sp.]|jgi:ubiquinone/menaquinone biosynthesis C-methylase UbiE
MDTFTDNDGDAGPTPTAQCANRQAAIEDVLRAHPGVREAAVVSDGGSGLSAFVVPDDAYVDDVLGRATAGSSVIGKWKKIFDLSQLSKEAQSTPVGFNTEGWNSSYTRGTIPADEMREWVENTVGDILRLEPKTVCEIGCGTGMLVMRIAPHCERYVAVDFSPVVLGRLREQLRTVPGVAARVEVMEQRANDLDGIDNNTFDTVVLSSVVQFFPNIAYLTKVLAKAVNMVKPGGHVYIGDVRSLPLLQAFASSVELFQAADAMGAGELRERIRRRIEREPELVLSPAYFFSLQREFPKISRVDIRPLRGRSDNEMTRFRYEAILHVGCEKESSLDAAFQDWDEHKWTLDQIRSMLRQHPNERIGITRIPNARIDKDLAAIKILRDGDEAQTAGELRRELEKQVEEGIHPQALFDLEAEGLEFVVYLSWAACRTDGSYDALFVPKRFLHQIGLPAIGWPTPNASCFVQLANAPGQGKLRSELVNRLVAHCSLHLPEESTPARIVLVDRVPRTADGVVAGQELLALKPT